MSNQRPAALKINLSILQRLLFCEHCSALSLKAGTWRQAQPIRRSENVRGNQGDIPPRWPNPGCRDKISPLCDQHLRKCMKSNKQTRFRPLCCHKGKCVEKVLSQLKLLDLRLVVFLKREGWSRCKSPLKAQWDSYAWVQMGLCMDKMFGQWEFMRARRTWTPAALHRLTAPLASFCSEAFGWVDSFNSFWNAFIPTAVAGIAEMKVWFQGIPRIAGLGEKLKGKSNDGIAAEKNLSWRCDRKESCGGWTSRWVGSVGMKATITEIKWKWKWTLWWKVKVGKWTSRSTDREQCMGMK